MMAAPVAPASPEQQSQIVEKMIKKQQRLGKTQKRLTRCSKIMAVIGLAGIAWSGVPFLIGAPDFSRPPPHMERDHRGPPHDGPRHDDHRPHDNHRIFEQAQQMENPNQAQEDERQANDRFEYLDEQYNAYLEERWEDKPKNLQQGRGDRDHHDRDHHDRDHHDRDHHDRDHDDHDRDHHGKPDKHHGAQKATDYFYRFNFFALMKWLFVFFAAVTGIKHARKTTFKNKRKNWRPVRKVRCCVITASLFGLIQMWQMHKFHREMKHLHERHDKDDHHDKPARFDEKAFDQVAPVSQAAPVVDTDETFFLNDDHSGRNLRRGDDHHGKDHHGDRHDDDHHGKKGGHHGKKHHGHHGCHWMKWLKVVATVFAWLFLTLPFMCLNRRFACIKMRLHKLNNRATEEQRAEVDRHVAENSYQCCHAPCRAPSCDEESVPTNKTDKQLKKLYAKANKMTAKLQKINARTASLEGKKQTQVQEEEQVACYYPPTATQVPLIETERSDELLMPPPVQEATYTLEQVHTLINMERERLSMQKDANNLN